MQNGNMKYGSWDLDFDMACSFKQLDVNGGKIISIPKAQEDG